MKIDGFLIAMLLAVGFALVWPQLGASGGPLPLDVVTSAGIALVFFLHGANLSREALASGATNWRLHLFVQSSTFILFPMLGAVLLVGTTTFLPWEARLGLFFLCALSSTVSSSIAMVALAHGNLSAAVFNASLSGLIGMVLTPLLMAPVVGSHLGSQQSVLQSILEIAVKLLLPFAMGHMLRPMLKAFLAKRKKWVSKLDRGVILLIVYASFLPVDGGWTVVTLPTGNALGDRTSRHVLAGSGADRNSISCAILWLQPGRRNHSRLLWIEEKPRERGTNCPDAVWE